MLGLRLPRLVTTLISVAFLMIAVVLGALYLWSPRATLRITTGPMGSSAQRFISTFVSVSTALHPHIYFKTVSVPDFEASAKALEDGKVDIAVVRSDVRPPALPTSDPRFKSIEWQRPWRWVQSDRARR
jgi:hypothetical protein